MSLFRSSLLCLLLLCAAGDLRAAEAARVAAASDLKFALEEISTLYVRGGAPRPRLSFGSSGNFKTQIENGAPFGLYLSADESYVFDLADAGLTRDRGQIYATGHLVLFIPNGSSLDPAEGLADLAPALRDGRLRRFAIANPAHAPYGRAAEAVLRHMGLWSEIQPRLVLGENASQAAQFAASGSTQGGIMPLSLSRAPQLAPRGVSLPIPAEWHASQPLRQRMVLTRQAGPADADFHDFLQSDQARVVLLEYGFALPETGR